MLFFLIFALFLLTVCASFKKDLVICGDCTKEHKERCIIVSDSAVETSANIMNGFGRKEALRSKPAGVAIAAMLPLAYGYWLPNVCATETRKHGSNINTGNSNI